MRTGFTDGLPILPQSNPIQTHMGNRLQQRIVYWSTGKFHTFHTDSDNRRANNEGPSSGSRSSHILSDNANSLLLRLPCNPPLHDVLRWPAPVKMQEGGLGSAASINRMSLRVPLEIG